MCVSIALSFQSSGRIPVIAPPAARMCGEACTSGGSGVGSTFWGCKVLLGPEYSRCSIVTAACDSVLTTLHQQHCAGGMIATYPITAEPHVIIHMMCSQQAVLAHCVTQNYGSLNEILL